MSFDMKAREDPPVGESPFIMVKKGQCSILEKVHNIEEAGGHLAIIISDSDDPVEGVFFGDEGNGMDITIPAILISKISGGKLVQYYLAHKTRKQDIKNIRLEVKFDQEKTNNIVKYDLWYTPDQENVYTFLKEFREYQDIFGKSAELGVHFMTYPHFSYAPENKEPVPDCLGGGKYCIRPGKVGIKDGSIVVYESIKQKCIYNYAFEASDTKKRKLFWDFMEKFYEKCICEETFSEECSNEVLKSIKIPLEEIDNCIKESFIGTSTQKNSDGYTKVLQNSILNKEYDLRKQYAISKVPSLTINGRLYMGIWRSDYIFDNLCSSLIQKPDECLNEVFFNRDIDGFSLITFILIILIILTANIILFIICKNLIRKNIQEKIEDSDINAKIDNVVGQYLALRNSQQAEDE